MLGGDWRAVLKAVGIGIAAVAFVTVLINLAFFAGISSGYHESDTHRHASAYSAETDQRIGACQAQADRVRAIQCVREAIEAGHANQRDENDLSAQRYMAKWAGWLLVVSLLQLPIGTVGLVFLMRTISQSKEALNHAKEATYAQNRAWMDVKAVMAPGETFTWEKGNCNLPVIITATHYGVIPAVHVSIMGTVVCDRSEVSKKISEIIKQPRMAAIFPQSAFPEQKVPPFNLGAGFDPSHENQLAPYDMAAPYLIAYVTYESATGSAERHATIRVYSVLHQGTSALLKKRCPIPSDQITLKADVEIAGHVA